MTLLRDKEARLRSQDCSTPSFHQVVPDLAARRCKSKTLRALLKGTEGKGLGDKANQASFSVGKLSPLASIGRDRSSYKIPEHP